MADGAPSKDDEQPQDKTGTSQGHHGWHLSAQAFSAIAQAGAAVLIVGVASGP